MNRYFFVATTCATALCLGTAGSTPASFVQVSSRVALGGTDFLDWGTKGPSNTLVSNPFTITSTGGVVATVSEVGAGPFVRRDQNNGWAGNFTPGDRILWTSGNATNDGPVTVLFTTPMAAAGANYMADFYGAFTFQVDALAADGTTVLASFTNINGTSNGNADGTAVFAGIQATGGDVFYGLRFTGLTAFFAPNDFAINQFDFTPATITPTAASAPAPAGLLLGLLGVAPAAALIRRRRTAVAA